MTQAHDTATADQIEAGHRKQADEARRQAICLGATEGQATDDWWETFSRLTGRKVLRGVFN